MKNEKKYRIPLSINFASRDEYLAWRDEWRRACAALSGLIRELKSLRSEIARAGYDVGSLPDDIRKIYVRVAADFREAWGWFYCPDSAQSSASEEARAMLELRKESKLEAQRQYLTARDAAE